MKVPITRQGHRRLIQELAHLKRVVRPAVLEDLQEARAFGARTDNHQYLTARERHAVLQKRLQDLETMLGHCEVVVGRKFYLKRVGFGTITIIRNMETGEVYRYQLVGPYESDVKEGRISVDSPVGQCLLGHQEGEEVVVYTPSGVRIYAILSIQV